jgi:hypothetical protein
MNMRGLGFQVGSAGKWGVGFFRPWVAILSALEGHQGDSRVDCVIVR